MEQGILSNLRLEKCGVIAQEDGKTYVSAYNGSGAALVVGKVYQLTYGYVEKQEIAIGTPATTTFSTKVGVAIAVTPDGAIGWLQTGGICEAYVEGTTDVAAGDFLEVLNSELNFKKDGSARTTVSAARAVDAQAANSAVLVTVNMINELHTIAAA